MVTVLPIVPANQTTPVPVPLFVSTGLPEPVTAPEIDIFAVPLFAQLCEPASRTLPMVVSAVTVEVNPPEPIPKTPVPVVMVPDEIVTLATVSEKLFMLNVPPLTTSALESLMRLALASCRVPALMVVAPV